MVRASFAKDFVSQPLRDTIIGPPKRGIPLKCLCLVLFGSLKSGFTNIRMTTPLIFEFGLRSMGAAMAEFEQCVMVQTCLVFCVSERRLSNLLVLTEKKESTAQAHSWNVRKPSFSVRSCCGGPVAHIANISAARPVHQLGLKPGCLALLTHSHSP